MRFEVFHLTDCPHQMVACERSGFAAEPSLVHRLGHSFDFVERAPAKSSLAERLYR